MMLRINMGLSTSKKHKQHKQQRINTQVAESLASAANVASAASAANVASAASAANVASAARAATKMKSRPPPPMFCAFYTHIFKN